MTTEDVLSELKQKERKVSDLIRYIQTRNDNNPNYCLLLGSGASVTSGIKSGGHLISEWRKEIYYSLVGSKVEEYSEEKAKEYLSKNCGTWYNKSNEYSSLFEKKYDLPRQRRMFVEKEVSNCSPSIGYAYLINLIKENYFNTLFTTNFDDLINEAFYQFSETRPILCAHDSSINSITVTSKRPKIIKLHGDYLFDDIKSTLRETESLEDNIRNKFIEYSKDYGLIVAGYSGSDRSIMDVLNYLLKHEEFFKNGIYWCIRENDEIGEELRKLLWKERVYFVVIEGFDELFAELSDKIFDSKLPINTNFISNKSQDIISKFLNNKYLINSKCEIIKTDLEKLKEQNEKDNIYEMIKQIQEENSLGKEKLSNQEVAKLLEVISLAKQKNYVEAIKLIEKEMVGNSNKYYDEELSKELINIYKKQRKIDEALKVIDRLIKNDSRNPNHYLNKINFCDNLNDKLSIIDELININEYHSEFYNEKILLLIENYDEFLDSSTESFNEIIELMKKSLVLNPSISNDCWEIKFDFLLNLKLNKKLDEAKNIICELKKQKPYSIKILRMEYEILKKEDKLDIKFQEEIDKQKELYLNSNKINYEILSLNVFSKLNYKKELIQKIEKLEKNDMYIKNITFLNKKASLISKKFGKFKESIKIYQESIKIKENLTAIVSLIKLYLGLGDVDSAEAILNKYKYMFKLKRLLEIEIDIYVEKKEYTLALETFRKKLKLKLMDVEDDFAEDAYYFMLDGNFKDANALLKEFLILHNYSPYFYLQIVNYEFTQKKLGNSVSKKRLEEIKQNNKSDNLLMAAIYCIQDEKNEAYKYIDLELEKDLERMFTFKNWPIFDILTNETRYKKYFEILDIS